MLRIVPRETFWKNKYYRVVESGPGWQIERPGEEPRPAPNLDLLLRKALRKKRYKWE